MRLFAAYFSFLMARNITRGTGNAWVLSVVLAVLCCAPHVAHSHSASMTCATTTIHVRLAPPHTEGSAASAQCTLTHKLQLRGGGRIDAGTAQRLLFEAAAIGNVSAIAKAIGEGADVDAPDPLGGKTLVICCVSRKPWLLDTCCSRRANISECLQH
jgi:hypothetical protein